ncbi:hypothetical protein BJV82DRAFT_713474 [Fennellomyces sp. T-0311]|nr:hypothetical protein BJV82DRAFT_713474 [Fennellomyces sp. T-0311]
MVPRKFLLLASVAVVCLALSVTNVSARATTEDLSTWTKEQYYDFLDTYGIPYKESESSIAHTVKSYKDAAAANAEIFGTKINHVLSGLKIKLAQQKDISNNNMQMVLDTIQHQLRQLELQGQLSRDRVLQSLDRIQRDLTKKKIVTESQWREIYNDVSSSFEGNQAWYQKVFTQKVDDASASMDKWLEGVQTRVKAAAGLTEVQAEHVMNQLRKSMRHNHNIRSLGDQHWRHHFKNKLKKQGELTHDQIQDVMNTLQRDVNAYKLFAMDYIGDVAQQSQQWAEDVTQKIKDSSYGTMDYMYSWWDTMCSKTRNYLAPILGDPVDQHADNSAYATIRAAVASVTDDWKASSRAAQNSKSSAEGAAARATNAASSSFESFRSQATDAANSWRESFAHFWHDKENDAYRQMGYTESQINWIQTYLSKAFTDQEALSKSHYERTLDNIRHYLQEAEIQTQGQIQHSIDRINLLYETWKAKFYQHKANN